MASAKKSFSFSTKLPQLVTDNPIVGTEEEDSEDSDGSDEGDEGDGKESSSAGINASEHSGSTILSTSNSLACHPKALSVSFSPPKPEKGKDFQSPPKSAKSSAVVNTPTPPNKANQNKIIEQVEY